MASDVDTYVREILDNVQVIEATRKLATEEKVLAKVREASGTAGVKAYKQVTAEAAKAAKEAERAAKGPSAWTQALTANTEAVKDSAKELGEFRSKVNLGAESLGKIGAALGTVSPEMSTFVQTAQKGVGVLSGLSGGAGMLGAALPPVAIAGGLVSAAFYDLEQQEKTLKAESAKLAEELGEVKAALEGVRDVYDNIDLRNLKLTDANAAKHLEAARAAAEQFAPAIKVVNAQLEEQNQKIAKLRNLESQAALNARVAGTEEARRALEDQTAAVKDAEAQAGALRAQIDGYREAQGALAGELVTVTGREEQAKDAKERSKEATKDATEAARERERVEAMLLKILLEEADAEIERAESLEQAKESLADLKRTSEEALATDRERIQLAAQAAREQAVAVANEAQAASDSAEERRRIAQDLSDTLVNIKADEAAKLKEYDDQVVDDAKEAAEEAKDEFRASMETMLSGVSDLTAGVFDLITQSQEQATDRATDRVETLQEAYDEAVADGDTAKAKALKAQVRAAEKGALDAFEAQQKTALAQAIVQGILGVATAAASAPPPANLIPMGVAALTGAAQVAAVKAVKPPEFDDTPEAMMARNMQPARAQVSLHRDDIFIAGKTPESVVNQAAGLAGGGSNWRRSFGPKLAQGTLTLLTDDVRRAARGRIRG